MSKIDRSYGIVPLKHVKGKWEVLLVKHGKGHWAFPKGHADPGEEPHMAAIRELKEETGLAVIQFLEAPHLEEKYLFRWQGQLIDKTVIYYIAEVSGEVIIQADEISDFRWAALPEAKLLATFQATKDICSAVQEIVSIV